MSVVNVPAPKRTTKGEPPVREQAAPKPAVLASRNRNLVKPEPGEPVGLNFKVSADFKRDFKIEAATQGLKQTELLQAMFEFWKRHQG